MDFNALAERIQAIEFDHPFTLYPDGSITDPVGVWAPECYHDDDKDIDLCGAERDWRPLTGMTGQDRYHGAVMHQSEFIGSGIARYLLELAGDELATFVVVVVECWPEDDEEDPFPAGWAILMRRGDVGLQEPEHG